MTYFTHPAEARRQFRELAEGEIGIPDLARGALLVALEDNPQLDGYRGETDDYYDPRNAYLNEVIDRRRGIPITLSIVFLDVATRVGLTAFGVGLPGHYIVKVQFELNEVYVDPFHDGATLTMTEIVELVSGVSGGKVRLSSEHLRSWTPRQTLVRVLANLQGMWTRAGDPRKAAAARERMDILQATDVPERS